MKHPLPLRPITMILGCLFIAFVVFYGKQVKIDMQEAVEEHARVVSTSLWNLDKRAQTEYLNIVAGKSYRHHFSQ